MRIRACIPQPAPRQSARCLGLDLVPGADNRSTCRVDVEHVRHRVSQRPRMNISEIQLFEQGELGKTQLRRIRGSVNHGSDSPLTGREIGVMCLTWPKAREEPSAEVLGGGCLVPREAQAFQARYREVDVARWF